MNLSKLFNYNYLIENIKKSKMTIALFFVIVIVLWIAYGKENSKVENFDKLISKKDDKYSLKVA